MELLAVGSTQCLLRTRRPAPLLALGKGRRPSDSGKSRLRHWQQVAVRGWRTPVSAMDGAPASLWLSPASPPLGRSSSALTLKTVTLAGPETMWHLGFSARVALWG